MAEAIFKDLARSDGTLNHFDISSAGTKDWDVGFRPDYRTRQILADHNIPLDPDKLAQLITDKEKQEGNYIIAMSERVTKDLGNQNNVYMLLDFVDNIDNKNIPDPYPTDSFPEAYKLINRGIKAFYEYIKEKHLAK